MSIANAVSAKLLQIVLKFSIGETGAVQHGRRLAETFQTIVQLFVLIRRFGEDDQLLSIGDQIGVSCWTRQGEDKWVNSFDSRPRTLLFNSVDHGQNTSAIDFRNETL